MIQVSGESSVQQPRKCCTLVPMGSLVRRTLLTAECRKWQDALLDGAREASDLIGAWIG